MGEEVRIMRKALSLIILVFTALAMRAQENLPAVDKSPLDVAYYPTNTAFRNFQKGAERDIQPKARILYSRPQKKGAAFSENWFLMGKYGGSGRMKLPN